MLSDWGSHQSSRAWWSCLKEASTTWDWWMTTWTGVSAPSLLLLKSVDEAVPWTLKHGSGGGRKRSCCNLQMEAGIACMVAACAHGDVRGSEVTSCFIQSDKGKPLCVQPGCCFSCFSWSQLMIYPASGWLWNLRSLTPTPETGMKT